MAGMTTHVGAQSFLGRVRRFYEGWRRSRAPLALFEQAATCKVLKQAAERRPHRLGNSQRVRRKCGAILHTHFPQTSRDLRRSKIIRRSDCFFELVAATNRDD